MVIEASRVIVTCLSGTYRLDARPNLRKIMGMTRRTRNSRGITLLGPELWRSESGVPNHSHFPSESRHQQSREVRVGIVDVVVKVKAAFDLGAVAADVNDLSESKLI